MNWIIDNVYLLILLACAALAVVMIIEKSKPSTEDRIRELERQVYEMQKPNDQ